MRSGFITVAALSTFILIAGCSRSTSPASGSTPPSASAAPAAAPLQAARATEGGDGAEHEHTAPHGGTLIELGEELAHVELLLDSATGTLTAFVLDGEAEQAVRLTQSTLAVWFVAEGGLPSEVALSGVANALTGETPSDTSQFRAIVPTLEGVTQFKGSIKAVSVRGQRFQDVGFHYPATEHE